MRLLSLLATVLFGLATPVLAESVSFETCSDAQGKPVPVEAVSSLPKLVQISAKQGRRLIQYNPELLPNLSATAKQFFYAQACASLALGAANNESGISRARRADCVALRALRLSGLLAPGDLSSLQRELAFTDEEWEQLPEPRRSFELAACADKAGIALPGPGAPTAAQLKWNACIRPCSDRLFQCQRQCAASGCLDACLKKHEVCEVACN